MDKVDFAGIFKNAWKITWQNKYLWWLGFFMFVGGGLGNSSYHSSEKNQPTNGELEALVKFVQDHWALIAAGVTVLVIISVALFVLGTWSRAAVIRSVNDLQLYRNLGLGGLLRVGSKYFWKIFFLEILLGLATAVFVLVLIVPAAVLFYLNAWVMGIFLAFWAVAIIIPAVFMVYVIRQYALLFLVVGDLRIVESLKRAYGLFRNRMSESLYMTLWMMLGCFIFGFIVIACLLPVAVVFLLVGIFMYLILAKTGIFITLCLAALVWLGLVLQAGSLYEIFKQAAWLLFFKQISMKKIDEKTEETEKVSQAVPSPEAV